MERWIPVGLGLRRGRGRGAGRIIGRQFGRRLDRRTGRGGFILERGVSRSLSREVGRAIGREIGRRIKIGLSLPRIETSRIGRVSEIGTEARERIAHRPRANGNWLVVALGLVLVGAVLVLVMRPQMVSWSRARRRKAREQMPADAPSQEESIRAVGEQDVAPGLDQWTADEASETHMEHALT